jgi:hypothetical protein
MNYELFTICTMVLAYSLGVILTIGIYYSSTKHVLWVIPTLFASYLIYETQRELVSMYHINLPSYKIHK